MKNILTTAQNLTSKLIKLTQSAGLILAILAIFALPGSVHAQDNGVLAMTSKLFAFNLTSPVTQIQPGLARVDINKVNIDHDPEAIKALIQQIAPEYGVDWKLVYAIGVYESGNYGSNLARNNNNFFGRKATSTTWKKYNTAEEGIRDQFVYIKTRYIDNGLDTPQKMNHMYCEGNTWQYKVQFIMNTV